MSIALLGRLEVISFRLSMPLVGIWTAEVEVDAELVPVGETTLAFGVENAAPITFAGTVLEQSGFLGRARAFVLGGAGKLHRDLPPRQYQLAPPRVIVSSILRDAGETAGDLSSLDKLPPLPRWVRIAGTGADALSVLCRRRGLSWRVMANGSVWVGVEAWPSFRGGPLFIEKDLGHRRVLTARDGPDVLPGVSIDGRKVGRAVHILKEGGIFRSEIHFERDT